MVYQGSGGPPPSQVRSKGGAGIYPGQKPFSFGLYEVLNNGKRKKIGLFRVNQGESKVPVVFLDEAKPEIEAAPSIRVHDGFKYGGKYGNLVLCVSHRPGGCQLDKALEREHKCFPNCKQPCPKIDKMESVRGSWRWVASVIKMKPFKLTVGPNAGKTLHYQRSLLLVPDSQYDEFMAYREQFEEEGGLRGKVFHVRRKGDQRSSKIGTTWAPVGKMTDEEMMEKFEDAAADYGLTAEEYCRPFNYEDVLKELSDDEIAQAAKWIAGERGISLDGSSSSAAPAIKTAETDEEEDADEVPF